MMRMYADNVLLRLLPAPSRTASGLHLPPPSSPAARQHRLAEVVMAGPGHFGPPSYLRPEGLFHPTEVGPGDVVVVDALAGDVWRGSLSAPRHQPRAQEFHSVPGLWDDLEREGVDRAEYRVVRHDEIHAVVEGSPSRDHAPSARPPGASP